MPPFLPRKRLRSESPEAGPSNLKPSTNSKGKQNGSLTTPRKPTLFEDIDAGTKTKKRTKEENETLLRTLAGSDDDQSSLSSLSDEDFEDVPITKQSNGDLESDDEDIEFEDVDTSGVPGPVGPVPSGDLELTLRKDTRISITNPFGTKKGPSKIERQIRISTHQVHVQLLMFHNAIRNSWLCDKELQDILVKQLPASMREAVEKWRRDSGLQPTSTKTAIKGKGKGKAANGKKADIRSQRDWGQPAERLEEGQVNMSRGDPLHSRLLKHLVPYWRQRFKIMAPGLRKIGYMSLQRLDDEMKSFNNDRHDPELHGELIKDIEDFKACAKSMQGSRDVGAQLFTCLLRGLGLEARMVANLQPVGIGWSRVEEATEDNPRKLKKPKPPADSSGEEEAESEHTPPPRPVINVKGKGKVAPAAKPNKVSMAVPKSTRKSRASGLKEEPIDLSDSEVEILSDSSVVDITPAKPRSQPSKPYDKDLEFPHYWTEVLSPVTNTYTPVDPIVLNVVAIQPKDFERFEARGAKAEKAKQVTTYIIGHSSDGTAKEVTTRYLRKNMWPSSTKGMRIGVEKIAIRNRHGKVKRYEYYDWFKTVMSGYVRGTKLCPRTDIDDHEEATILKPNKPEKKVVEEGKETLQSYKSSTEFVLERHLRREEALIATAKHVKMFTVKAKGETSTEEKVYLRKDVVNCKSMETWHKEGRAPIPGEVPLKRVPYRAATTNRKRELAEAEHASGEKLLQGLYSWDQTEWIIPPPIENGVIPKNSFGNIDLYVESMLPKGAAHLPFRGTMKICKRLGIDYAEAVTGFEFGHRMAVPIITGVVVAEENYDAVMEEWQKDEAERVRKEDEKRTKAAIGMWRKMLMGLRIIERIREEYGDDTGAEVDEINPWSSKKGDKKVDAASRVMEQQDEDMAGGLFPEGHDEEEAHNGHSAFFAVAHDEDEEAGGFVIEGHEESAGPSTARTLSPFQNGISSVPDSDEEMEDIEPEPEVKPKPRGRPAGSTNKPKASQPPKPKTPAKKPVNKAASIPKTSAKRKQQISDSEGEEDSSSLSELETDVDDDEESDLDSRSAAISKKSANGGGRRVTMPARPEPTRKTPRRQAARKSEGPTRSKYFEHSDEDDFE